MDAPFRCSYLCNSSYEDIHSLYYTTDLEQISTHLIQIIYIIDIQLHNNTVMSAPDFKPMKSQFDIM